MARKLLGTNNFRVLSPSRTQARDGGPLFLSRQISCDILSKLLPTSPTATHAAATCSDNLHITLPQRAGKLIVVTVSCLKRGHVTLSLTQVALQSID